MAYDIRINVSTNGASDVDKVGKALDGIRKAVNNGGAAKNLAAIGTRIDALGNAASTAVPKIQRFNKQLASTNAQAGALLHTLSSISRINFPKIPSGPRNSGGGSGGSGSRGNSRANQIGSGALQLASSVGFSGGTALRGIGMLSGGLGSLVSPAGIATGVLVGLGAATVGLVKEFAEAQRESQNLADRLGITVGAAQRLQAEAKITGVNVNTLTQATRLLGEALSDPAGKGKKAYSALQQLGVSTIGVSGDMEELGPVVLQVLEKLSHIENDAKRAALAQQLLGRGAKELLPLIKNYQELQKIVSQFHVGEDAAGSKELEKANRAIQELDLAWTQFKRKLAEGIAPVLVKVIYSLLPAGSDPNGLIGNAGFGIPDPAAAGLRQRAMAEAIKKNLQNGLNSANNTALSNIESNDPGPKEAAAARNRDLKTKEGLQDELKRLTKDRDELRVKVLSPGLTGEPRHEAESQLADTRKQIDDVQKKLDALKEARRDDKRAQQEEIQLQFQLTEAIGKSAFGIEQINAKRDATLQKLSEEHILTRQNLALVNEIAAAETARYNTQVRLAGMRVNGQLEHDKSQSRRTITEALAGAQGEIDFASGKNADDTESGIQKRYSDKVTAAAQVYKDAQSDIARMREQNDVENSQKPGDLIGAIERAGEVRKSIIEATTRLALDELDARKTRTLELIGLEKQRQKDVEDASKNQKLISDASTKADIADRKDALGRKSQIIGANAGPGEELVTLQKQLALKTQIVELDKQEAIANIQSQLAEQQKIAANDPTQRAAAERQIAELQAQEITTRRDAERQISDERLEVELKVAEIRKRQEESYVNFVQGLLGAAMNGGQSVPKFLENFAKQQAETMIGNLAHMSFPKIAEMAPKIPGLKDANGKPTGLGKILNGTVFGGVQDPTVKASTDLKVSQDALKASVDNLNTTISTKGAQGGGSGTGGTGTGGIPGMTSGPIDGTTTTSYGWPTDSKSNPIVNDADLPLWSENSGAYGEAAQMGKVSAPSSFGFNAKTVASIGAAGAGAFAAMSDFKTGGAKNVTAGVGASLGSAAAIASLIPGGQVAALGLGIASGVTSLISSFLGDPKQARDQHINNFLAKNQYQAPQALNVEQDTSGNYVSTDARGNLRTSNYRAVPSVAEPYMHWHSGDPNTTGYFQVPGNVLNPFTPWPGGAPPGAQPSQPPTIIIQAMDQQSFSDFAQKNHGAIGNAAATNLQMGDGRLHSMIRQVAG